MSALEELMERYGHLYYVIKESEREMAKIMIDIKAIKPDVVGLDFLKTLSKPLSELTSPINDNEEKPHRSEVEGDGIKEAQRQEEVSN